MSQDRRRSSAHRRVRPSTGRKVGERSRRLTLEALEGRQLLAGFVAGTIDSQDGWSGGTIAIAPAVSQSVDQSGNHAFAGIGSWNVSNATTNGNHNGAFSGWPFAPGLAVTAGQPSSGAVADLFQATFYFKAGSSVADGSNIEVDLGTVAGDDRNTFLALTNNADASGGLQLRISEPDGVTGNFKPTQIAATQLSRTAWHRIDIVARFNDGNDNDTFEIFLNGVAIVNPLTSGTTFGTFEGWRNGNGFAYAQVNRLFWRSGAAPSAYSASFNNADAKGFYFDDVSYVAATQAAPGVTLASYSARFEPTGSTATPSVVHVDDDWQSVPVGADPDGAGPATAMGYDAFASVQAGVQGVSTGGTVHVAAGDYNEDVVLNKAGLQLLGADAATTVLRGDKTTGTSSNTVSVVSPNVMIDGFTITRDGNTVAEWNNAPGVTLNDQGVSFTAGSNGGTLRNSIVTGNRNGVYVNNAQNIHLLGNVIDDNRTGVQVANNVSGLDIRENSIANNWTVGLLFNFDTPVLQTTHVTVQGNSIVGNWYGGVVRRWTNSTAVLDVQRNWFGAVTPTYSTVNTSEPGYAGQIPVVFGGSATNPGGAPDVVDVGGAPRVDFSPALSSGADTSAAPGFQGSLAGLAVATQGGQLGSAGRIQEAVNLVATGGTVVVNAGTYIENVSINRNLALRSVNGRGVTTIQGISNAGAQGAVTINGPTTGVQIGDTNQGFKIIGIDNGLPGQENAAVYFAGNHANAVIRGNEIVANGDLALVTEYSAVISGFVINDNVFSGQTFVGPQPADVGTANQFTVPNVPRPLVYMGGGVGGGNTSNTTFTDNLITGTTGGLNGSGQEQGNLLVSIDSNGATINGNQFAGTTMRAGTYSLRARGPNTTITGNSFSSAGLSPLVGHVFTQATGQTVDAVFAANTFDTGVYVSGASGVIFTSLQAAINAVPAGTTLQVPADTYVENVTVNKNLTLNFATGAAVLPTTGDALTIAAGTTAITGVVNLGTHALVVASGGTLAGDGQIIGPVNVQAGGVVSPGFSPDILYTGDYNQAGSLLIEIIQPAGTPVAGVDYDQVNVAGAVTLSGNLAMTLSGVLPVPNGTIFTIISNDGSDPVTGNLSGLSNGATFAIGGQNFAIFYNGGDGNDVILLAVPTLVPNVVYVEDNDWDLLVSGQSIVDADYGTAGNQAAVLGFNAFTSIADAQVHVAPGGTIVIRDGNYAEALNLSGNQTVRLTGSSELGTGTVATSALAGVAGNTLLLGVAGSAAGLTTGDASSTVFSGTLTGLGKVTKQGSGTLTLQGSGITFQGDLAVNAGTLQLQDALNFGNGTAAAAQTATIGAGSVLDFNVGTSLVHRIGATPGFVINGSGTWQKTGAGTLALDELAATTNQVRIEMTGGLIDVQQGLLKNGGWLGQIWTSNKASLNIGASGTFDIWDGSNVYVDALTGTGLIQKGNGNANRELHVGVNNGTGDFAGKLSGSNGSFLLVLHKDGTGTQTLSGTQDNNGATAVVNAGVLELAKASSGSVHALGSSSTVLTIKNGGTVRLAGTGSDQIYVNGDVVIDAGGVLELNGRSEGFDALSGNGSIRNSVAGTATLTVGQNNTSSNYDGTISNPSGTVNLTKSGTGTLTLTGNSTYSGTTTVSAGTLLVNNASGSATGSGLLNVNNTATLGGTGIIAGNVQVNAGGKITGGTLGTVGTLSIGGQLAFNGGTYAADFSGDNSDRLLVAGAVDIANTAAGVFAINSQTGIPSDANVFKLIDKISAGVIADAPLATASEGGSVNVGGKTAYFTYAGGNGNDFVLVVQGTTTTVGTAGGEQFELRRSTNGSIDNLEMLIGGVIVDARPYASVTSWTVQGAGGSDTLLVNYLASGGQFDRPIAFHGGVGGNDLLQVAGGAFQSINKYFTNATDGTIDFDPLSGANYTISYTGLEPVLLNVGSVVDMVFHLTAASETAVVEDDAALLANTSQIRSTTNSFETTAFTHPSGSLTMLGGAGDNLQLALTEALGAANVNAIGFSSIDVGQVATTGIVTLLASGAISELGSDAAPDLIANQARLSAGTGIGNVANTLELNVAQLAASNSATGDIRLDNLSGAPLVIGVVGIAGVTNNAAAGVVRISNNTGLVVAQNVSAVGSVTLVALETAANDVDNVTIGAGVAIQSLTSNVLVRAADNIVVPASAQVLAPLASGVVSLMSFDSAADTEGSELTLQGNVDAQQAYVTGSAADDVFTVAFDSNTPIEVQGYAPTLPTLPGDVLNVSGANLGLTVTGLGDGIWNNAPAQPITFYSIESVNASGPYHLVVDGQPLGGGDIDARLGGGSNELLEIRHNNVLVYQDEVLAVKSLGVLGSIAADNFSITQNGAGLLPGQTGGLNNSTGMPYRQAANASYSAAGRTSLPIAMGGDATTPAIFFQGNSGDDQLRLNLNQAEDVGYFTDTLGLAGSGTVNVQGKLAVSFNTAERFDANGNGGAITIDASSLPVLSTMAITDLGVATQVDGNAGFADAEFSNFGAVTIRSGMGQDLIDLIAINPVGLNSVVLDSDSVQNSDVNSPISATTADDTLRLRSLPVGVTALLRGGIGRDTFQLYDDNDTVNNIQGLVTINGEDGILAAGGFDKLVIKDSGDNVGANLLVNETTVQGLAGPTGAISISFSNIDILEVTATSGDDSITVDLDNAVSDLNTVSIDGAAGQDDFDVLGIENLVPTVTPPAAQPTKLTDLYLFGGTENDIFGKNQDIRPSKTVAIHIDGGSPTPAAGAGNIAGDELYLDMSQTFASATAPILVDTVNGVASSDPNQHKKVYFKDIESVYLRDVNGPTTVERGDLYVRGTEAADRITLYGDVIQPAGQPSKARLRFNNTDLTGFFETSTTVLSIGRFVVYGQGGNDQITIANSLNRRGELHGGAGDDYLVGSNKGGDDLMVGGVGNDRLQGMAGNDVLWGDELNDAAPLFPSTRFNDRINGGQGNDFLYGGLGNDALYGEQGNDVVRGDDGSGASVGNDTLSGDDGDDIVLGGAGNDKINGGRGRDLLIGGIGLDTVSGDAGDDIVVGDASSWDENSTANDAALLALLFGPGSDYWTSANPYATRVANMRSLLAGQITDDSSKDKLTGGLDLDWFLDEGVVDTLSGRIASEFIN